MFLDFTASVACPEDRLAAASAHEPTIWQNSGVAAIQELPAWLCPSEVATLCALLTDAAWVPGQAYPARQNVRRSDCGWLTLSDDSAWLYRKIIAAFLAANETYRFELCGLNEEPQILRYGPGDFFDWHLDLSIRAASVRKLALVALLDRSSDCAGGTLELVAAQRPVSFINPGDAVIFPSFIAHRVTKLLHGSRVSLVTWACGPAFR